MEDSKKSVSPVVIHTVTKEQIQAWKDQHGDVFSFKVDDHIAYLKKPGRRAIGTASAFGAKDPIKFNEMILEDCFIGGDPAFKTNDELFMAISAKLADLIIFKQGELEKL